MATDLFPDALQSMPVMGAIGDAGAVLIFDRAERLRILTKYFPDDGFHAVRVDTSDFDLLYGAGSYLVLTTGTVRSGAVGKVDQIGPTRGSELSFALIVAHHDVESLRLLGTEQPDEPQRQRSASHEG